MLIYLQKSHLGGPCKSGQQTALGICPDTEMPRIRDKPQSQVAAQPIYNWEKGWKPASGTIDRVQPYRPASPWFSPGLQPSSHAGSRVNGMTKGQKVECALERRVKGPLTRLSPSGASLPYLPSSLCPETQTESHGVQSRVRDLGSKPSSTTY